MEERQLHERHQLAKRQLKDLFFLQRHQMLVHHEKELEHLKRMMDRKEEDLIKNQTLERKALPKRIRQEMKAREMMFRESMRISVTNLNEVLKPIEEKDRLKKVRIFLEKCMPCFITVRTIPHLEWDYQEHL